MTANGILALLYICNQLAPSKPCIPNTYAGGWLDLNDIARKIGLPNHTAEEAERSRRFIYDIIRFGARAEVYGERTTPYHDEHTNEQIPTQIDKALWAILSR